MFIQLGSLQLKYIDISHSENYIVANWLIYIIFEETKSI